MLELAIKNIAGVVPIFCGTWNALTNSPPLTSGIGKPGEWYKISHDGNTNIDGVAKWKTGDVICYSNSEWIGLSYLTVVQRIEKDSRNESFA